MNWYFKVWQNYVNFEGRARRKEYWMFFLFNILISYGLQILAVVAEAPILFVVALIYSFAVLLPAIGVGVRRMHDVGKSGWFILVPFYNFYLACCDSEPHENKWGPNPKADEAPSLQKV